MPFDFLDVLSVILMLLLIIAVFIGAYFTSKFVGGRYQSSLSKGKSKIEILERRNIGKDQYLLLVKIGDKTMFLGATPQNINKIEDVELLDLEENLDDSNSQPTAPAKFSDILKDMISKSGLKK